MLAERTGSARHDVALVLGSGWVPAADLLGETVAELPSPTCRASRPRRSRATRDGPRGARRRRAGRWCSSAAPTSTRARRRAGRPRRAHRRGGGVPRRRPHERLRRPRPDVASRAAGADQRPPQPDRRLADCGARRSSTSPTCTRPGCARCAARSTPSLPEGVYAQFPGPQYETPAEVRMAGVTRRATSSGMSTALEAIAAREAGLEVLGHVPRDERRRRASTGEPLDHEEVLAAGNAAADAHGRAARARSWRGCERGDLDTAGRPRSRAWLADDPDPDTRDELEALRRRGSAGTTAPPPSWPTGSRTPGVRHRRPARRARAPGRTG